jgi:capsular polysaccharide transport system ATP-binding protein
MIHFVDVTHTLVDPKKGRKVILINVTATLPTDRYCEIDSTEADPHWKTGLLRLASGALSPDAGRVVVTPGVRLSPLINRGAGHGPLLFHALTVRQNILFQARLAHVSPAVLIDFVMGVCSLGAQIDVPFSQLTVFLRRAVEAMIFIALPYDCYFVDHLDALPDYAQLQVYSAAKARGAGMIFSCGKPWIAKQFRDMTARLGQGALRGVAYAPDVRSA